MCVYVTAFVALTAEVLLNSTDREVIWKSDTASTLLNEWSRVEVGVSIAFPTTAELTFRGEVIDGSSVSLKGIAVKDSARQNQVGQLRAIKSTGGSVLIQVDTSSAIPDPLFYRVKMRKRSSNATATLVYAGLCSLYLR